MSQEWYMSFDEFLESAKGFDDLPAELQQSFREYDRDREKELSEPRANGGIILPHEIFERIP